MGHYESESIMVQIGHVGISDGTVITDIMFRQGQIVIQERTVIIIFDTVMAIVFIVTEN